MIFKIRLATILDLQLDEHYFDNEEAFDIQPYFEMVFS